MKKGDAGEYAMTFRQIGDAIGVTHQRAKQIFDKALEKLARALNRCELETERRARKRRGAK